VSLFAERLKPVVGADSARLAKLIADLDSPQFTAREGATRTLRELGLLAESALRTAERTTTSPEVRKRVHDLLAELDKRTPTPEELRALRAIEVLEWIDTPDARKLLGVLAGGAEGARQTSAAKAALSRAEPRR
jgi:hypothetical protein